MVTTLVWLRTYTFLERHGSDAFSCLCVLINQSMSCWCVIN